MKKLFACLVALLLTTITSLAHAVDISREALQGRWLITAVDGEPETVKNHWEFAGDKFRQIEEGKQKSEETYTVKGQALDLGYMSVRIVDFDGKNLQAQFAGFKYSLKKQ